MVFFPWETLLGTDDVIICSYNQFNTLPQIFYIIAIRLKYCLYYFYLLYFRRVDNKFL